jgi:hypothetical protein
MKKIFFSVIIIAAVLVSIIAYLVYTEKMIMRLPIIIQKNPKITFIIGSAMYRTSDADKWEGTEAGV